MRANAAVRIFTFFVVILRVFWGAYKATSLTEEPEDAPQRTASVPSSQQRQEAQQCLLELFTEKLDNIPTNDTPILYNTRLTDKNTVALIFSHGLQKVKESMGLRPWVCVTSTGDHTAAVAENLDPTNYTFTLGCPANTRSVYIEGDAATKTYTTTGMIICEKKSKALFPITSTTPKLVCCTMIDSTNLPISPQFVEYYRLLGFDQIWLFYNDDWQVAQQKYSQVMDYFDNPTVQEYASLIPHEWSRKTLEPFFYQRATQADCLALSRQRNVTWTFLNDVDEYLQIRKTSPSNYGQTMSVQEFLKPFQNDPDVCGLQISNWFFGAPSPTYQTNYNDILLIRDYPYRSPTATRRKRKKCLVKPNLALHHNIHYISHCKGNSKMMQDLDPTNEIRLVHFKLPETSYNSFKTKFEDTSLADQYLEPLRKRLQQVYPVVG